MQGIIFNIFFLMLFIWSIYFLFFLLNPGQSLCVSTKSIFNANFKLKACTSVHLLSYHRTEKFWQQELEKKERKQVKWNMTNDLFFQQSSRRFNKNMSQTRHAHFPFHVNILNSLGQCVDSRYPCTREIRAHMSQKKILWNDCRWLLQILDHHLRIYCRRFADKLLECVWPFCGVAA